MTTIRHAQSPADIAEIRALFEEYSRSLEVDLCFQGFDEELATLPGAYAPPTGCLLLALADGMSVGCIGVRPLDESVCEMKRLYVRPDRRSSGAGRALAEAAIGFARSAGYRAMRLDTLPTMVAAQALYGRLGFRAVPPYRPNPVPGAAYLELVLNEVAPARTPVG